MSQLQQQIIRDMVHGILADPLKRRWTLQGFGMLRTYLTDNLATDGRKVHQPRLNVWDSRYQVRHVSLVHDHPWNFDSYIVMGKLVNRRYVIADRPGRAMKVVTIQCGEGGCITSSPMPVYLSENSVEVYGPGDTYHQDASEIHVSVPDDSTVTINYRTFHENTENARVFWPAAEEWVSAEPRRATDEEILDICGYALKLSLEAAHAV